MPLTLERVLTSPAGFGLVEATPLQRACCRIIDGLRFEDLLATHPELGAELEATCGPGGLAGLAKFEGRPREVYLLSGIRTAKSLILAAVAFRAAMTVDLAMLRPWEKATISILSLKKDKARIIMSHLLGPLLAQPKLRTLLARKPTGGSVWLRRPNDGRVIRIQATVGARAGGSLVGDWSAGALFDEFPRMLGEEEHAVINFDESRRAVLGRLLPGAQLIGAGSPWAPKGAAYEIVKKYWGNPSKRIVVIRPPSRAMNPVYWTDETIEELRKSPKGEHVYKTDYLGEFADPETAFFTTQEILAVTRVGVGTVPPDPNVAYFAAIDPAMMRNAWTLVIGGRDMRTGKIVIALCRQWVPAKMGPLNPEIIFAEIKRECLRYRIYEVYTDRWKSDELAAIGEGVGLTVTVYGLAGQDAVTLFDSLKLRVLTGKIEFPDDPELRTDLLGVRRVVRNRTIGMDLPFTNDGRHCDYAPSLAVVNALASEGGNFVHAMQRLLDRGGRLA